MFQDFDQASAMAGRAGAAAMSSQFTPHMWPSGSSKLRPYMKLYSSLGLGSGTPPAASALPTISSTSFRLSADRQNNAWFEVLASAIGFGVNWRNLSWVVSMTKMVSERTMQLAVPPENCGFL